MEDFGFGMFIGAIIGVFIASMIFLGISENTRNDERAERKQFELCLKNDMQWIDGNCISSK